MNAGLVPVVPADVQGLLYTLGILAAILTFVTFAKRSGKGYPQDPPPPPPDASLDTERLYTTVQGLIPAFNSASRPDDLLGHAALEEGVWLFNTSDTGVEDLLGHYTGDNPVTAIMALEALTTRGYRASRMEQLLPEADRILVEETILRYINTVHPWTRFFALRALRAVQPVGHPLIGRLLFTADASWAERTTLFSLRDFIAGRIEDGEVPTFEGLTPPEGDHAKFVDYLVGELKEEIGDAAVAEWRESRTSHTDLGSLQDVGRVLGPDPEAEDPSVLVHPALRAHLDAALAKLLSPNPTSLLAVGRTGVGKRSFQKALAVELRRRGWTVFEAGHPELLAGQIYIGQLEGRVKEVLAQIAGKPHIAWFVEDFQNLLWGGRHSMSPLGILDLLLPVLEKGEITMVGEIETSPYEHLLLEKPQVRSLFEPLRIEPLRKEATLELAGRWADANRLPDGRPAAAADTLHEAWELADQYMGTQAAPGNVLRLLHLSRRRLLDANQGEARPIELNDLIASLSAATGLPASVLDDRHRLDLGDLRRFFESRVMGQEEAVSCLVERVAMIKAGVSDPTRPLGVFLFAGPTGTGKTEIAKALGEFLFGSPERVLRIDMSELQHPDSLSRLLGDTETGPQGSLAHRVRQQPFSLILLDEFEKAHMNVWDLFLQVFDDGRLTDKKGNTADFRNSIIILTSNLGSVIPKGTSLGFGGTEGVFHAGTVERAISQSFRKEFLNRLDRIVVFRPLTAETMKEILRKELDEVVRRRGLRSREWAVEWEEDALDFLLEQGFTPDLGARPLKRAVERYFLTPLALTIVDHAFPEGDQFLFVRRDGKELRVDFVDPDAPPPASEEKAALRLPADGLPLRRIVLEPLGTGEEVERLQAVHARLRKVVDGEAWQTSKRTGLEMTSAPGFWDSPERFTILGDVEYIDRIERTLQQTGSLLERLAGPRGERLRYAPGLVQRVAQQLFLLDAACNAVEAGLPRDAFLLLEGSRGRAGDDPGDAFARRLGGMYRSWAEARRMRWEVLEESAPGEAPYRLLLSVAGYAAYALLAPEQGLHVLEVPGKRTGSFERFQTRVRVAPQPDTPPGDARARLEAAREALEGTGAAEPPSVARRYREEPSPLVRDARGWRTGRLERVLAGDFDVISDDS